jgi:5'-nucleotidase (lipoprotein e(P4) family)
MRASLRVLAFATLIASSGCAHTRAATPQSATPPPAAVSTPAPASPPAPATASAPRQLPRDIRWVRNSAEYRALTSEVYRAAASRLPELTKGMAPGSWGVILDGDETVFDNSEYQVRRTNVDSTYSATSWAAWCYERAAGAVPGAAEFTKTVQAMHGRVAIVTNRADSLCAATRDNLQKIGVTPDVVLCEPPGERDKNPRFQRLQNGTAAPGLPPLKIVEWFGDNIYDFPNLSQASKTDTAAIANFGRRYFAIPNPMYGSWERLP